MAAPPVSIATEAERTWQRYRLAILRRLDHPSAEADREIADSKAALLLALAD